MLANGDVRAEVGMPTNHEVERSAEEELLRRKIYAIFTGETIWPMLPDGCYLGALAHCRMHIAGTSICIVLTFSTL